MYELSVVLKVLGDSGVPGVVLVVPEVVLRDLDLLT